MTILLISAAIVLLADQASKYLIVRSLNYGEAMSLIDGYLYLSYVDNPGAAFGILPGQKVVFLTVTLAVIAAIVYFATNVYREHRRIQLIFGVILGGTLGNLSDRIFRGEVIDFIDVRFWPVFNIADVALVIGAALLTVQVFFGDKSLPGQKSE